MQSSDKSIDISEERIKKYKSWIKLAKAKHKKDVMEDANKYIDRLNQKFPSQTEDSNQSIYNYYHTNIRRLAPELLPKEIKTSVKPKGGKETIIVNGQPFDNKRAAIILDNKIQEIFKDLNVKYTLKMSIYDLLVANLCCIIVGQQTDVKEEEEEDTGAKEVLEEKAINGDLVEGEKPATKKVDKLKKSPSLVVVRESYKNISVDPDSVAFFYTDKRFAVRQLKYTLGEAKSMFPEQFKDGKPVSYDIGVVDVEDREENEELGKLEENKKIKVHEVYDNTQDGIVKRITFFGEGKVPIEEIEFDYDPVTIARINYVPDQTYTGSDFKYYEALVDEANFYRTVAMNQFDKSAARKVLTLEEALGQDDQAKLQNNKDMEIVTVKTKGRSLGEVVKVEESARVNADIGNMLQSVNNDIMQISTVNEQQLGKVVKSPATNASIADSYFKSGAEERLNIIKDFLGIVVQKMVHVLKQISIENESFFIENPDGTREEVEWTQKDIANADVTIEIDFNAGIPTDVKMKRMQEFINWVADPAKVNMLAAEGKKIKMFDMIKEVGKFFVPDANFDKLIVDDNSLIDPDREIVMMLAGQPAEPNPNEDFNEHLQVHTAFVQQHPMFQTLDPQIQQLIVSHIEHTKQMAQEQQSLQKGNPNVGQGQQGNLEGGALNVQ